jgi:aspartyl-tRNA(Asn)/glutamyl-tRNA(Gln) amidotransferase subunit A
MTEFAYSGVGINPHYGTPGNPHDRTRIPGGSSSGAAVAVADGMCEIAIGSDTGGSVRLPAALCGIVGFKPTARRVPIQGALPLSTTLDSIGPLARTVADCAIADAVMAGEAIAAAPPLALDGARLLLLTTTVLDGLDDNVTADFARALTRLSDAGARIVERKLELIDRMAEANAGGGFAAAEAFAWHRDLLARRADAYDPRVRARIERGKNMSAADYIDLCRTRARLVEAFDAAMEPFDAAIMPTAPFIAPKIAAFADDGEFARLNVLLLRNTMIGNFFDLCGISLPMSEAGAPPTGLMLLGRHDADRRLLRLGAAVETALSA